MNEEKRRILDLLAEGKITAEEAELLMEQLGEKDTFRQAPGVAQRAPVAMPHRPGEPRLLRIRVYIVEKGSDKPSRVEVNLPLKIAKIAGKLINMMPEQARDAMDDHGIDLSEIDWEDVVSSLSETGGDIVNVTMNDGDQISVRIYVE